MGAQTQQQLHHLQAKLSALESTQRATDEEHARILCKQREQTEELQAQNAHMRLLLGIDKQEATPAQQERIDKLHDLVETYTRKVEVESRQLEAMQQELEVTQAKIQDVQRITGGPHAAADSAKQAARARLQLENRLEQAEKRFGEALTRNKVLRRDIDRLNKDKASFQQLCGRVERDLASACAELEATRSATAVCEEARTVARQQVVALQLQAEKEAAAAELELAEMEACQEADKKLLQVQAQRIAVAAAALDEHGQSPAPDSLDSSICDSIVSQLQGVAGISELPALVAHFSQLEALNYELFNECNQANERVGDMQKQIKALQLQAQQAEHASGSALQKEVIRTTQAKHEQAIKRAEAQQGKKVVLERRLALLRAGVGSALKSLGGRLTPAPKPEDPASVLNTLIQNLGQLEARSRAVLAVHSTLAGRDTADSRAMLAAHMNTDANRPASGLHASGRPAPLPAPQPGRSLSTILSESQHSTIRGTAGDSDLSSDDDDDDAVPLTRQQLQARLGYGT